MSDPKQPEAQRKQEIKENEERRVEQGYYDAAVSFAAVRVGDTYGRNKAKKNLASSERRMINTFGKDVAAEKMMNLSILAIKGRGA